MIEVLYSSPTFILHDYYSIIAFTSSILPQRFNSIRSLLIQQLNTPIRGSCSCHFLQYNDFSPLRHLTVYSPIIPPGSVCSKELSSLELVVRVVCRMPALRELRLDLQCYGIVAMTFCSSDRMFENGKCAYDATPIIELLKKRISEGVKVDVRLDTTFSGTRIAGFVDIPFVHVYRQP